MDGEKSRFLFFFSPGESRQNCPKADIWDVSQPVLAVAINRLTGFSYLGMFDYRAGFKDIGSWKTTKTRPPVKYIWRKLVGVVWKVTSEYCTPSGEALLWYMGDLKATPFLFNKKSESKN